MPISRCRALARASTRFAVLPHTASSSSSMMPLQQRERGPQHPLRPARRLPERQHLALHLALVAGYSCASWRIAWSSSACACSARRAGREPARHRVAAHAPVLQLARAGEQRRRQRRRQPEIEIEPQHRALKPRGRRRRW